MILGIGNESFLIVSLVLAIWRVSGFLPLLIIKSSVQPLPSRNIIPYRDILTNRTFILYFVPWLMFLIINSLSFPINKVLFGNDLVQSSSNVESLIGGISAVIFGFFADSKGRKRLAVAGFALLGLGYGVLAFTGGFTNSTPNLIVWYFYTIIDGITWGSLIMIFVFALWGDIAEKRSSERIYAIAIIPYLLSAFIRISLGNYLANVVTGGTVFSLFSFFLFIAVLPLVIAPETLSDQAIKNNDLKSYVDKAQKQVSKNKKTEMKSEDKNENNSESKKQSDEYEKAQELAEKYY
jgi:MFS family permease